MSINIEQKLVESKYFAYALYVDDEYLHTIEEHKQRAQDSVKAMLKAVRWPTMPGTYTVYVNDTLLHEYTLYQARPQDNWRYGVVRAAREMVDILGKETQTYDIRFLAMRVEWRWGIKVYREEGRWRSVESLLLV